MAGIFDWLKQGNTLPNLLGGIGGLVSGLGGLSAAGAQKDLLRKQGTLLDLMNTTYRDTVPYATSLLKEQIANPITAADVGRRNAAYADSLKLFNTMTRQGAGALQARGLGRSSLIPQLDADALRVAGELLQRGQGQFLDTMDARKQSALAQLLNLAAPMGGQAAAGYGQQAGQYGQDADNLFGGLGEILALLMRLNYQPNLTQPAVK